MWRKIRVWLACYGMLVSIAGAMVVFFAIESGFCQRPLAVIGLAAMVFGILAWAWCQRYVTWVSYLNRP